MTLWIHLSYYALFLLTLHGYWRDRQPVRRDIVAVFASVAVFLAIQDLRQLVPGTPAALTTLATVVLLAEPFLCLRLVHHVRRLRPVVLRGALAAYLVATVAYVVLGTTDRLPMVGVSAYFVGVQCLAAVYLAIEATRRAGSSRHRLRIAAVATGLVGVVILGSVASNLTRLPGQAGPSELRDLFRAMILVATLCYLVAFIPPKSLRQLGQRATAFEFVRSLALLPRGTRSSDIWGLLLETAMKVTNASAVAIAELRTDGGATVLERRGEAGGALGDHIDADVVERLIAAPGRGLTAVEMRLDTAAADALGSITATGIGLDADTPLHAMLVLGFETTPLFAEDDIELLAVLGTAAARAVDRETAFAGLERQEAMLADAQHQAHLGSWVWDIDEQSVTWSDELYRIHGLEPRSIDILADRFMAWVHPDDRDRVRTIIRKALVDHEPFKYESRVLLPDGGIRTVATQGAVHTDLTDRPVRMVGTCQDVSERRHLEERLTHQALHDALTELPNRALFADRLSQAVSRRSTKSRSIAVIFLDLDDFKGVNDTLGHAAGDTLLREAADRIGASVRPSDTVARFGGDEFAVLLDEGSDTSTAIAVADRILEALQRPVMVHDRSVTMSASLGIALNTTLLETADDLMRNADVAMYRAKASGKHRRELFDPEMYAVAMDRLELKDDLQRAVKRDQLRLHYQPIVDLRDRRVVGFEALLRWQHHSRGLLAPGDFIPLAEETGLIDGIGRWVLRRACEEAASWQHQPRSKPLPVAVNLSAQQLSDPGLVSDVAAALQNARLPADRLTLEITETVLIDDPDAAVERLEVLKSLGVRLAIDDFGTGYSSLSYLTRFPIDTLKIDRSFVGSLTAGPDGNTVARIIVELGEALGLDVIAEGVETEDQLESLLSLGCSRGQGYLFSRALDAADMQRFLARPPRLRTVGRGLGAERPPGPRRRAAATEVGQVGRDGSLSG